MERLASELPNVTKKYLVPDKYFTHIDFIWAKDAKTLLNDAVIEHMTEMVDENVVHSKGVMAKSFFILTLLFSFTITLVR